MLGDFCDKKDEIVAQVSTPYTVSESESER